MSDDRWLDGDAGPVVRPYTVTRGRTRLRDDKLGLIFLLQTTGQPVPRRMRLAPEHRRVLEICARATTFADVASELDLPVGVVRVLIDDLRDENLLRVLKPTPTGDAPDETVLRRLLDGLQAL